VLLVAKWLISGIFTLLIILFTVAVWRAQRSGGVCSDAPDTKRYRCRLIAPENLPNDYLVIVGMGGVFVAIFTLTSIQRQTRSTHHQAVQVRRQTRILKNSAQAALLNARAVMTAERPWLLVPLGFETKAIQEPYLVPVERDLGQRMSHCFFTIKNYGNTPGQVFASKDQLQISDSPVQPPDISVYDMANANHTVIAFPPGESVAVEARLEPFGFIEEDDLKSVLKGGKYLWLCGFVRYRDTFQRKQAPEHETRFCYIYENRMNAPKPYWRLAGPPEFNRAT
jgi:hypothetical protein